MQNEPMAWWIVTGITTILIIVLGALLKLGYSSLAEALKEFKEVIKELSISVININKFLERQDEININSDKKQDEIEEDLKDYNQRLNKVEKDINGVKIIEENYHPNPFKK